jgi:hypothetical protein
MSTSSDAVLASTLLRLTHLYLTNEHRAPPAGGPSLRPPTTYRPDVQPLILLRGSPNTAPRSSSPQPQGPPHPHSTLRPRSEIAPNVAPVRTSSPGNIMPPQQHTRTSPTDVHAPVRVIALRKSAPARGSGDGTPPVIESPVCTTPPTGDDFQERASCGISETESLDGTEATTEVAEGPQPDAMVLPEMYDLIHSPFALPPGLLRLDASEFDRFLSDP